MFTLFAFLSDPTGAVDNDALLTNIRENFAWAREFEITTEKLHWPDFTNVVMIKDGWKVSFQIRTDTGRSLNLPVLGRALRRKKIQLPAGFDDYTTEIAIGFGDDPDRVFTDDIINIGEFIRETYPGVVIYNAYEVELW